MYIYHLVNRYDFTKQNFFILFKNLHGNENPYQYTCTLKRLVYLKARPHHSYRD